MPQSVHNRVSEALKSKKNVTELSHRLGVSRKTLYRWINQETNKFSDTQLEKIAEATGHTKDWLEHGVGLKTELDRRLNQIGSAVSDAGSDYRGADQTLLNIEYQLKRISRELQFLFEDLEQMKKANRGKKNGD